MTGNRIGDGGTTVPLGVPRLDNRGPGWDRALRALAVALLLCLVVCSGGCRRGGPAAATQPGGEPPGTTQPGGDGQTPGPVTPPPATPGAFPGAVATAMPNATLTVTLSAVISGEGIDIISGLAPSGDGGWVLAGETKASDDDTWDGWLVKVDAAGEPVWARTCGGAGDEMLSCIRRTSDGGYIVAGFTSSVGAGGNDASLVKFDSDGNQLWMRTYGGPGMEYAQKVQQTSDGGFIVVGGTQPPGGSGDAWLIKTDAAGNETWSRTFGGAGSDGARGVQQLADGGYIVVGETASSGAGAEDIWLCRTDTQGNELWSRTFGGSALDWAWDIQTTGDGGYIIAGYTASCGSPDRALLLRTDGEGNQVFCRTFGGAGVGDGIAVLQTSDGGFVLAGGMNYDLWLLTTDAEGNGVRSLTLGGPDAGDMAAAVLLAPEGGCVAAGSTGSSGDGSEGWLVAVRAGD